MFVNVKPFESLFDYKYQDCETGFNVYKLKGAELDLNECHLFFPVDPCEEFLVATALEHFTFHPNNKVMNEKYKFSIVKCDNIELFWCSFPKEFKDVCKRTAQLFKLTMKITSRAMVACGDRNAPRTCLEFPAQENLLCFEAQNKRCSNPDLISRQALDIIWVGNCIDKSPLD